MLGSAMVEPQDYFMFIVWLGPAIAVGVWIFLDRRKSERGHKKSSTTT
jgi:hypothetical protein